MDNFSFYGENSRYYKHHSQLSYPNPHLDIASTYLPKTLKEILHLCRYYFRTNPIINPIIRSLAEYPITDILVDEEDPDIRAMWKEIIDNVLKLKPICIEAGLDYFTYGNCFIYISYPVQKWLICRACNFKDKVENCEYRWRSLNYEITCKKCGNISDKAAILETVNKDINKIRIIRINPELVDIEYCSVTGKYDYFVTLARALRNDIVIGKRHVIESIPDIFIEALRENKRLRLSDGKLFHFKRPSISDMDTLGWGEPIIYPVMKSAFYMQVLRKAQEAIMHGCIIPLRIIFPQGGDNTSSPYQNVNLFKWTNTMKTELIKWRRDPNHIPIIPLPTGNQIISGEGKSLVLFQELDILTNEICNGMGVPIELLKGGLSWSGSNMSLRLLENKFLNYRTELLLFVRDFILGSVAKFLKIPKPKISFDKFKMADDLQRSALEQQIAQQQQISWHTVLEGMGHDAVKERKLMEAESNYLIANQKRTQMAQATIQGETMLVQSVFQAQAQKKQQAMMVQPSSGPAQQPGQQGQPPGGQPQGQAPSDAEQAAQQVPGMPEGAKAYEENAQQNTSGLGTMESPVQNQQFGMDVRYLANQAAKIIEESDPLQQTAELEKMKMSNPDLFTATMQIINSGKGSQFDPLRNALPDAKPPRSPNATI